MPKGKDKKPLTAHGAKVKAGKLLSSVIRKLAEETVSMGDDGELMTRAEALGRIIWNRALGYIDKDPKTNVEVKVRPDKAYINIVLDRMEGRAQTADAKVGDNKASVVERVSEQSKRRVNQIANFSSKKKDDRSSTKTDS